MAFGFTYTLPTITGSHTNYAVLLKTVDFPSAAIDGTVNAIDNGGGNLRAYTDDGKGTQLSVEIVTFVSSGSPDAQVRVKIPTAATGDTIYIEADAAESSQPAVGAAFGRNSVWTVDKHVIHCEDTSTVDSTGNGPTPTLVGTIINSTLSNGQPALDFDGAQNTRLHLGDTGSITGDFYAVAWANSDASSAFATIIGRRTDDGGAWELQWRLESLDPALLIGSSSPNDPAAATSTGTDYLLGINVSGTTITFYRDGVSTGTGTVTGTRTGQTTEFSVGGIESTNTGRSINGKLAKVRLGEVTHTADWFKTVSENESTLTAWGTVGSWADSAGGITITANYYNILMAGN